MSGFSCGSRDLLLLRVGSSLRCGGFSLLVVHELLFSCGGWAPEHVGPLVVARGLSCPVACGILVP